MAYSPRKLATALALRSPVGLFYEAFELVSRLAYGVLFARPRVQRTSVRIQGNRGGSRHSDS